MPDVDCISQIECLRDREGIGSVVVHVVPVRDLGGAAMTAAIVRDDPIPLLEEEEHLGVPVIGGQRPAVVEHDRLGLLRAPVLVEDGSEEYTSELQSRRDLVCRLLLEKQNI